MIELSSHVYCTVWNLLLANAQFRYLIDGIGLLPEQSSISISDIAGSLDQINTRRQRSTVKRTQAPICEVSSQNLGSEIGALTLVEL